MLLAIGEFIFGIVTGRRAVAAAVVDAWRWNFRNLSDIRRRRSQLKAIRLLPDGEVRRLQTRGSARMTAFVRGQLTGDEEHPGRLAAGLEVTRRELAGPGLRATIAVWAVLMFVLLFGSRLLLGGHVAAVGELAEFPGGPRELISSFLSGWRTTGVGGDAAAPPAFALLGMAGTVFLGAMGLLRKLLILGPLVGGLIGMHHLARPLGRRPRLVATIVYAALPLPYDALARGRWGAVIAYGITPWILGPLLRATGLAPFVTEDTEGAAVSAVSGDEDDGVVVPRWPRRPAPAGSRLRQRILALGLLLAVSGAFAPAIVFLPVLIAVGLVIASLLTAGTRPSLQALLVSVAAAGVAAALLFPWTLDFVLPGSTWSAFAGVDLAPSRGLGLARLLRFETGPIGAAPLGWTFLLAATLPLIVGKGWRLAWAARMWFVAMTCWGVVWLGGRLAIGLPSPELLLAPAAAAIAVAVALGLSAFEVDLPGYRFGWRQAASLTAAGAVVLGVIPWLSAATNGRWNLPRTDLGTVLAWMPEQRAEGDFRVLWVGDPEALPLGAWRLDEGVAYATSRGGPPTVNELWPSSAPGAGDLMADSLRIARRGETTSLGHLLAPMAVRYIVVPKRNAPGTGRTGALPAPRDLRLALASQLDLRQLESDPAVEVYENASWGPLRAKVSGGTLDGLRRPGLAAAVDTDLTGARPALDHEESPTHYTGRLTPGYVYMAEAASGHWQLRVDGKTVTHDRASWANAFAIDIAGQGSVRYRTPPSRYLALLLEAAVWFVVIRLVWKSRHRRRVLQRGDA